MERTLIVTFSIFLVLGISTSAYGCLCGITEAAGAFESADVVFVGKVVDIRHVKQASVALLVMEKGESVKPPRWEKSTYPARIVTLEVTETFKGSVGKTFQLVTLRYDDGATCGVNFKIGESFLVYADKRRHHLAPDQAKLPKAEWTNEISLKADADKYNERLPGFETTICARTERIRWARDDVDVIRRILRGEAIPRATPKTVRIIN